MFISITNFFGQEHNSANGWKAWLKYVLQHAKDLQISKAALVYQKGSVAACTTGFNITAADIKTLKACFSESSCDTVRFGESTYVVKSMNAGQLVAFTGRHYLIVSRTAKMFIITTCDSRQACGLAAGWVNKIAAKLTDKNF